MTAEHIPVKLKHFMAQPSIRDVAFTQDWTRSTESGKTKH